MNRRSRGWIIFTAILTLSILLSVTSGNKRNMRRFHDEIMDEKYEQIGISYANLKLLTGHFFKSGEDQFVISGTEIPKNLYYENNSLVFVYNISENRMVLNKPISGCSSMTAMCETVNSIFFGTISASRDNGCDLYRYDKEGCFIELCCHVDGRGIYALAYDENDHIIIATSDDAAIFLYGMTDGKVEKVCTDFSDQGYIRSMEYHDGYCYLGMGSKADLIKMDVTTGSHSSILPVV